MHSTRQAMRKLSESNVKQDLYKDENIWKIYWNDLAVVMTYFSFINSIFLLSFILSHYILTHVNPQVYPA